MEGREIFAAGYKVGLQIKKSGAAAPLEKGTKARISSVL